MHCTVLQYHNGIAGLFYRPEPRKPQVAALSALRGELPGLGSSGLAARPAGKPGGILRGALLHHLYQHGAQKRCAPRREHSPSPGVAEGLHRLPGGLVQRGLQHIGSAVYAVCCNGVEQRRYLQGRGQQTALPKAEIGQLAALRQLLRGGQLPGLGGRPLCRWASISTIRLS